MTAPTGVILILVLFAIVGVTVGVERIWDALRTRGGKQDTNAKADSLKNIYDAAEIVIAKIADIATGNLSRFVHEQKAYRSAFMGDITRLELLLERNAPGALTPIKILLDEVIRIEQSSAGPEAIKWRQHVKKALSLVEEELK